MWKEQDRHAACSWFGCLDASQTCTQYGSIGRAKKAENVFSGQSHRMQLVGLNWWDCLLWFELVHWFSLFTIVLLFFSQRDIFNILITPMTLDWTRGADSLGAGPRLWRRNAVRWDRKTFVKDQSAESYSLPHLHFGDSFTHVMYCNRRASRLPRGRREAQARRTTWSPDQKPRMLGETYYYS